MSFDIHTCQGIGLEYLSHSAIALALINFYVLEAFEKYTEKLFSLTQEQIETQWKSAFIAEDDGKTASKFRKLMGMKETPSVSSEAVSEDIQKLSEEQRRKQQELFQRLDQEYQFARMTTHTQRGVGLGFSTTVIDPNHPNNPP